MVAAEAEVKVGKQIEISFQKGKSEKKSLEDISAEAWHEPGNFWLSVIPSWRSRGSPGAGPSEPLLSRVSSHQDQAAQTIQNTFKISLISI